VPPLELPDLEHLPPLAELAQVASVRLFAERAQAARPDLLVDEAFVRAWDLYLAGSEVAFVTGSLQLFQVVFARAGTNAIPWTRTSA